MSNKIIKNALAIAVAAGVSANAWAIDPQSIRLTDGVVFTPSLAVAVKHDDNLRAVNKNKQSSWVTNISPSFQLNADRSKSAYQLQYTASSDIFHSSHRDDNVDHHFTGDAGFEFNSRNRLLLNAGYHKMEDTASSDNSIIGSGSSDKYNDKSNRKEVGALYSFGAQSARVQADFGIKYDELRYDNSIRVAGIRLNSDKERDSTALKSTVYYAVAPKTKVLLEGRYTDYDYVSFSARDSKNKALLTGITWDATAKTTGSFKIGRERKTFDKSVYSSKSSNMWEADVTWAPLTYSSFDLSTRHGFDEGENGAGAIKTRSTGISWNHSWADRLSSTAGYARTDRKYQGVNREDNIDNYNVKLTYQARRWLDFGAGYTFAENKSDVKVQSYKRNIYALSVTASL